MDSAAIRVDGQQPQLRLFPGDSNQPEPPEPTQSSETADGAHRSMYPGRTQTLPGTWLDWESIAAAEVRRVELPEGERQRFAEATTLRGLYEHTDYGLAAAHAARVSEGTLAAATAAKVRQALNRWERWAPRPSGCRAGAEWQGRPIAYITDQHATDFVNAASGGLASATVRSTWNHLRTVLLWAVTIKALDRAPEPAWGKSRERERLPRQFYDESQLAAIYGALAAEVGLQVAFVVACNCGLRASDLFALRWEDLYLSAERPRLEFTARKTGKRQLIPLGPVTVSQLRRWQVVSGVLVAAGLACGPVWPECSAPGAAVPEKSRAARTRNQKIKAVLKRLGMSIAKPWQVCRLTCNERLERHRPGSGQFVLGHANTLNSVSYREPSGLVWEAVSSLPQPPAWGLGDG